MPAPTRSTTPSVRRVGTALSAVLLCGSLAACTATSGESEAAPGERRTTVAEKAAPVRFDLAVRDRASVPIGEPVELTVEDGDLEGVKVAAADGTRLEGRVKGGSWHSTGRLEPGTDYV